MQLRLINSQELHIRNAAKKLYKLCPELLKTKDHAKGLGALNDIAMNLSEFIDPADQANENWDNIWDGIWDWDAA